MVPTPAPLHLAVALDGVGWHPAAWREPDDRFQADSRTDRVRGRLDAVLIAARVAPATRHIGFVPTAITTHTEPFHLSKAIATLDYAHSSGRAFSRREQHDRVERPRRRQPH